MFEIGHINLKNGHFFMTDILHRIPKVMVIKILLSLA